MTRTKADLDKIKNFAQKDVKDFLLDFLIITVACFMGGIAIVTIMIPSGLSSGGLTGTVRILQQYLPFDFSTMYYIGAITILTICVFAMGMREARKIALMSIMYPTAVFILEKMHFKLLDGDDLLLSAIYCGVFFGICNGIAFSRGYFVLFGLETKVVKVEIITCESEEISRYIMNDMYRGASLERIIGAYSRQTKDKLVVLCSPRESIKLRQYVAKVDDRAFVAITHMDGVWGNGAGFNNIDKESIK